MKALIIGSGSAGQRHARNLFELGVQDRAFLRSGLGLTPLSKEMARIQAFTDWDAVAAWGPQIAVIANPSRHHLDAAERALALGCHLYIEKPISHASTGLQAFLSRVQASSAKVMVGCQMRHDSLWRRAKEEISAGKIGKVFALHFEVGQHLLDWHPGEDYTQGYAARKDLGGGVLLTLIHEIDLALWLLGPLKTISANGGKVTSLQCDVEDYVVLTGRALSGALVSGSLDYWARPARRRFRVVGELGEIEVDAIARIYARTDRQGHREEILEKGFDRNAAFLGCMREFLAAIHEDREPQMTLADGVNAVGVIERIKLELEEKP
jgi:predicted dehydrogenase